jgi:putative ABC transport system ATP-binding protein
MENSPIVEIAGLNHWFGQGAARKQALFDINLTLARGSFTVLMGPSGSGKTTLLTLIGCLRAVQEGTLRLIGEELKGADEARLVMMRRKLGFIFQAHNLHESLTAGQNVMMGAQVHPGVEAEVAARAAGHLLGLRVAVARALVGGPALLLADEPTAALDKDSASEVIDLLRRLGTKRGMTTLLVTHDNRILDRADRILTLEDGRIVADEDRVAG